MTMTNPDKVTTIPRQQSMIVASKTRLHTFFRVSLEAWESTRANLAGANPQLLNLAETGAEATLYTLHRDLEGLTLAELHQILPSYCRAYAVRQAFTSRKEELLKDMALTIYYVLREKAIELYEEEDLLIALLKISRIYQKKAKGKRQDDLVF